MSNVSKVQDYCVPFVVSFSRVFLRQVTVGCGKLEISTEPLSIRFEFLISLKGSLNGFSWLMG